MCSPGFNLLWLTSNLSIQEVSLLVSPELYAFCSPSLYTLTLMEVIYNWVVFIPREWNLLLFISMSAIAISSPLKKPQQRGCLELQHLAGQCQRPVAHVTTIKLVEIWGLVSDISDKVGPWIVLTSRIDLLVMKSRFIARRRAAIRWVTSVSGNPRGLAGFGDFSFTFKQFKWECQERG